MDFWTVTVSSMLTDSSIHAYGSELSCTPELLHSNHAATVSGTGSPLSVEGISILLVPIGCSRACNA